MDSSGRPGAAHGPPPQLLFSIIIRDGAVEPSGGFERSCLTFSLVPGLVPLGSMFVDKPLAVSLYLIIYKHLGVFGGLGSALVPLGPVLLSQRKHPKGLRLSDI